MKKRVLISVVCGLLSAVSVFAKPYAISQGTVDFEKVNVVLDTILKEAIALEVPNGDNYDFVTPYFDPVRSSLADESLAYSTSASVKNTPWSNGRGAVKVNIDTYLKSDRTSRIKGISATTKSEVLLDLLELTRYISKQIITGHVQYDSEYEARELDIVNHMGTVSTLKEFYQVALNAHDLSLELIDRDIAGSMEWIECLRKLTCGNVTRDEWGNVQYDRIDFLSSQVRLRQLLQTKTIALNNTITFDGASLTVSMNPQQVAFSNADNVGNYNQSSVTFTEKGITVNASGFIVVKADSLDQIHRDLERELTAVELDDAAKHDRLQKSGRGILVSFRKVMAGERPAHVDQPFDFANP